MKKQSPAKQGKMSLTYTKTNKKTGKTTTNNNTFKSNNSLVAPSTPDGTSMKNYIAPIGKGPDMNKLRPSIGLPDENAKTNLKSAVGKMKTGPFKMKGFSGYR